jgi:hypothetical protein
MDTLPFGIKWLSYNNNENFRKKLNICSLKERTVDCGKSGRDATLSANVLSVATELKEIGLLSGTSLIHQL